MPVFAPSISLSSGFKVPSIGLGTFKLTGIGVVKRAISAAIDAGYRHIDTAFIYANETEIGAALKEKMADTGLKREDLFITTKLWGTEHHPSDVLPACKASLKRLGLDYVDLYLVHWPVPLQKEGVDASSRGAFSLEETWTAMEGLVEAGLVRSLGVSNFNAGQLERVLTVARVPPAVLQVEASIAFLNDRLVAFAQARGIAVTAYAPFGSPGTSPGLQNPLEIPTVVEIAKRHGKTPGQVLIRHGIQRGLIVIPKSATPQRIRENIEVFDFELSAEEMAKLNTAEPNQCRRFGLKAWSQLPEYPFHVEF